MTGALGETLANFNSQPHKEADRPYYRDGQEDAISTHSLTRRLTFVDFC